MALGLLAPVVVLCVECFVAFLPGIKPAYRRGAAKASVAILIPAHNEEAELGQTLAALLPQLRSGDRVLVVADNCDDTTADIARRAGDEVVERRDFRRRGKGYALDFGMRVLAANPPDILVMVDADCCVHEGAIDMLVGQVIATGHPAQACYLLEQPIRAAPGIWFPPWHFWSRTGSARWACNAWGCPAC